MEISLSPEQEKLLEAQMKTGRYRTTGEVITAGLRLLEDRALNALRSDVGAGLDAIERGEYTDYSAENLTVLSQRAKGRGRNRLKNERTAVE